MVKLWAGAGRAKKCWVDEEFEGITGQGLSFSFTYNSSFQINPHAVE